MFVQKKLPILFLVFLPLATTCIDQNELKSFVQKFVHPGSLVFDVGSHIGQKAQLYIDEGARVICFEPQPSCISVLRKKYNDLPNVSIEPIGLADKPGEMTMSICSASTTLSTFSKEWSEKSRHRQRGSRWDKTLRVPITTLDMMIKKYGTPEFIKIDVENFEHEVLRGLSSPVTCLSFEFHTETFANAIRCLDYLESTGYQKFNFAGGEYPAFVLEQWVDKQTLLAQLNSYKSVYLEKENDPLWGDIYARHP